jgi:hypothetical protein
MEALSQLLEECVLRMCDDVRSPRALTVKLLVKAREYRQLFSLKTDPHHYATPESYFADCQVTDFLRKIELDIPGLDLDADAKQVFLDCEAQCCRSNVRLSRFLAQDFPEDLATQRVYAVLAQARKVIREVLGALPLDLDVRFGPGGTFEDRGALVSIPDKMSSYPTVTKGSLCLRPLWDRTAWARASYGKPWKSSPRVVRGNRFTTVPKDALKRRGICIEPSFNVSYQLAVGRHMKTRLQRAGLDLRRASDGGSAQAVHQSVARAGSSSGEFATIDLSNASDTVSYGLVKALLPGNWFSLLETLRSPFTLVDGKWYHLAKFSSMGCGFTFELETLVFAALARACALLDFHEDANYGRGIWVYGDDIIVPSTLAPTVIACLKWCGLTANPKKTFYQGSFRESCGGDFFDGVAVRPHFQKDDPDEPQKIIALANGVRRAAGDFQGPRRFLLRSWFATLDFLPQEIRKCRGPSSYGDLVIHDDKHWNFKCTRDGRGYIRTFSPVATLLGWENWSSSVVLASALYGARTEGVSTRHSKVSYRLKWTPCIEREVQ